MLFDTSDELLWKYVWILIIIVLDHVFVICIIKKIVAKTFSYFQIAKSIWSANSLFTTVHNGCCWESLRNLFLKRKKIKIIFKIKISWLRFWARHLRFNSFVLHEKLLGTSKQAEPNITIPSFFHFYFKV